MRIGMMVGVIAVVGLNFGMVGCAQNAAEKRAVSPTISERFSHDLVTGRINEIGARHVAIRDNAGDIRRVRVNDQTKMDQMAIGDQVKAFVTQESYASTIQRIE